MKKILMFLFALFICVGAIAHTINWYADGQVVSTTSCQSGDNITPPTAPAKTGYHFVRWESGYTKLEYLESTGRQYIDTGVLVDSPTMLAGSQITFAYSAFSINNAVCGSVNTTGDYSYSNYQIAVSADGVLSTHGFNNNGKRIAVNEKVTCVADDTGHATPNLNFYLFAKNQGGSASNEATVRMYNCVLYANGTLVRNFVPAKRNSDNVLGMYDTVSGQFFTNAGTGTFIAGPEIGDLQ